PAAPGPKEYAVMAIPGVIAAGQQWKEIWQVDGNNAVHLPDLFPLLACGDDTVNRHNCVFLGPRGCGSSRALRRCRLGWSALRRSAPSLGRDLAGLQQVRLLGVLRGLHTRPGPQRGRRRVLAESSRRAEYTQ